MKRVLSVLGFAVVGTLAIASAKTTLYGVRFNGELFRLNPDTGDSVTVGPTGIADPNALALSPSGMLYAVNFTLPRRFVRLDMATGAATNIVASGFPDMRDLAFVGNTLYGIRDGGTGVNDNLVTINTTTGAVATIGSMGRTGFQGLCAFGSSLYAWDTGTGLHTVNLGTGAATDVNASVTGPAMQGMAFAADGVMYGCNTGGTAYRINYRTGEATEVSSGYGDVRGLCSMPRSYRIILRRSQSSAGDSSWRLLDTGTMEVSSLATGSGSSDAGTSVQFLNRFASGITLSTVDPGSGAVTSLPSMGRTYQGFAYNGAFMYGVSDSGTGILYQVDTNLGSGIPIGNTGFTDVQGLSFVGGQLYGWDTVAGLIRISTGTGVGTDVNAGIGGSANIKSLETTPDGTLLGFGDKLYVIDTATGAFESRGGSWAEVMGASIYVAEDADFLGISSAGLGYRTTRSGALTATGWSTGLTNWNGLRYGDDGFLYIANSATNQLLTVNPATGAMTFVASAPSIIGGLGWSRPETIAPDADSLHQGGDLYATIGSNLRRFNPITSGWDVVQALPYLNVSDTITFSSGRMLHGSAGGNWHRLDSPFDAPFDLGVLAAPSYSGLEILPDGTVYASRAVSPPGSWHVVDPITGSYSTSALVFAVKGLAFVGSQLSGTLTLGDYFGDPRTQTITVEYRHRNSTTPIEVRKVRLRAGGTFFVACLQRGGYDVAVKGAHWLRKVIQPALVSDGLAMGFGTLTNGDVDNDNEVGIGDYSGLSTAFNSFPGDPNWNPNADLNGDDAVDIGDYSILSANYGEVGDD